MKTRINKYMSEIGYCSRREADRLIEAKRILINNEVPEIGQKIDESDEIKVDGKIINHTNEKVYLLYNKPYGITSTTDEKDPTNIVKAINYPKRLFHVGRLDKDSEGLIIMTNDGDIVNEILRAENEHEKEYIVKVDKRITPSFMRGMEGHIPILDTVTKKAKVKQISAAEFSMIITEGMNRQIRRMCAHFDYKVVKLKRIRIMHLPLDMPKGKYRHMTDKERETLFKAIKQ